MAVEEVSTRTTDPPEQTDLITGVFVREIFVYVCMCVYYVTDFIMSHKLYVVYSR